MQFPTNSSLIQPLARHMMTECYNIVHNDQVDCFNFNLGPRCWIFECVSFSIPNGVVRQKAETGTKILKHGMNRHDTVCIFLKPKH